jgi:hypothetical protein
VKAMGKTKLDPRMTGETCTGWNLTFYYLIKRHSQQTSVVARGRYRVEK